MRFSFSRELASRTACVLIALGATGGLLACSAETSRQTASAAKPAAAAQKDAARKDAAYVPRQMVMRRLSAEQYQNVIHDVFGPTIELGGRFEPDLRVGGLLAVGAGDISITAAGIEQYDLMARRKVRLPRDWPGSDTGSGNPAAPERKSGEPRDKPIGGPAGEH